MAIVHLITKPEYRKYYKDEHGTVQSMSILSCPRKDKLSGYLGPVRGPSVHHEFQVSFFPAVQHT